MKLPTYARRLLGLTAIAGVAIGMAAAPAQATPVPPNPTPNLIGTWVNTNAATRSVVRVIVAPNRVGSVNVDAFGACSPTLCQWGSVPARVYGASVSSTVGGVFQSEQRFLAGGVEWSRTALIGRVTRTAAGLRLTVRELTVFSDGSGRKNYAVVETFRKTRPVRATLNGHSVAAYRQGVAPALNANALGSWTNVAPSGNLVAVTIGGTTTAPIVQAFGSCSPTACDWGRVRGITYGTSISSASGDTLLAPYYFGFKRAQLVILYSVTPAGERLTVTTYNEFTDGSGRSNYLRGETFVRS